MKKNILLFVLCLMVSLSLMTIVNADGNYICPSCGKVLNYDANIKWVSRITLLGNEIMDSVMYCPYCGYNTERDSMGNIKLKVIDLWEYRYGIKPSSSGVSGCGCNHPATPTLANNVTSPPSLFPPSFPSQCSQDAELCSNGSYVNRIGPNCEFSPCPK